jgi:formate hydrogenlyase subunit 6/NADH:ubiquinone oxidoreductase subunit I
MRKWPTGMTVVLEQFFRPPYTIMYPFGKFSLRPVYSPNLIHFDWTTNYPSAVFYLPIDFVWDD